MTLFVPENWSESHSKRFEFTSTLNRKTANVSYPAESTNTIVSAAISRSGVRTPGWRQLKALGRLPQTGYTYSSSNDVIQHDVQPGTCKWLAGGGIHELKLSDGYGLRPAVGFVPPLPSSGVIASTRNAALAKFNEHVRGNQFQGIPFLGEVPESYRMLAKTAASLAKGFKGARRKILRAAKNPSKHAADAWLEYHFGWKPLFNDIRDAAKAIAEYHDDAAKELRAMTSGSSRDRNAGVYTNTSGIPYSGVITDVIGSWEVNQESKFGVIWQLDSIGNEDQAAKARRLAGLRPEDVIPGIWELIPYSWLADYVTNIGDLLNWYTIQLPPWYAGYECTRTERTLTFQHKARKSDGYYTAVETINETGVVKWVSFSRVPLANATFRPRFEFQMPNAGQFANIGALLASRLGGLKPPPGTSRA